MAANDPSTYVDTPGGRLAGAAQFYWNGTAWVANGNGSSAVAAGSAGGLSATASFTPAAAAYGAGTLQGTTPVQTFAFTSVGSVAVPSGSLVRILTTVVKIDVTAVPSGQTSYTLQLYSVTPPSAQADKATWTLASADLPSYLGSINLGTPVNLGAALYIKSQYVDFDIRLASASLFGVLVTVGAHTAAAVARQVTLHGVVL